MFAFAETPLYFFFFCTLIPLRLPTAPSGPVQSRSMHMTSGKAAGVPELVHDLDAAAVAAGAGVSVCRQPDAAAPSRVLRPRLRELDNGLAAD